MKMEWTTVGGQQVVLLLLPPNFATDIKVSLSVMDMAQVTQNNKSSTRSFTSKGRYTIEMECLCGNALESTDIRQGFNRLKAELVGLPLWMDSIVTTSTVLSGSTSATFDILKAPSRFGSFWVFIDMTTFLYEVVTVSSVTATTVAFSPALFTWSPGSLMFPLIFGRFSASDPPEFTKLTESVNTIKIKFEENSPFSFAVSPVPKNLAAVQPALGLSAVARLWNVPCTYAGNEIDYSTVDIDYERIGFVRQDAAFVYPQAPRRVTELAFEACDRQTISIIENFLIDRQGRTLNLWVPSFRNDADLIENLPDAVPTHISIAGGSRYLDTNFTSSYPGFPYLCINDNVNIFPFKVVSISGNVLTSLVPVTTPFASSAKISALMLSRFQEPQIQWTYHSDGIADTAIKFVEATEDYQNAPAEQLIAQCYIFTVTNPAGSPTYFYTSFEQTLVVPGLGTFTPGLFSHGAIKTGLDMGSDEAEIISFQFPNNPLSLLMPWTLVGDLQCRIYDVNRSNLAFVLLFHGTVEELNTEGAKITAKVLGFGGLYDQQFHRHVMAGDCPYAVYTPECGASKTVFSTVIRTIIGASGNIISVSPAVGGGVNVFAGGIFEVSSGGTYQIIHITSSSANLGGFTQFNLSRPLTGTVIGATATISLGCGGTIQECIGFSNLMNFGGEINIPVTNPSVSAVTVKDSSSPRSNK